MGLNDDKMFMQIANVIANTKSTCLRRKVAALIVKDGRILSTGYNGAPSGLKHCKKCLRKKLNIPSGEKFEICNAVHAEANAIIYAARKGISIEGAILYVNTFPCTMCAKMIINSGIRRIVFTNTYSAYDVEILKMLNSVGIDVFRVDLDDIDINTFQTNDVKT